MGELLDKLYQGGAGDQRAAAVIAHTNTFYPVVGYTSCPASRPVYYTEVAQQSESLAGNVGPLSGQDVADIDSYTRARYEAALISYEGICAVSVKTPGKNVPPPPPPKTPPPKTPPPKTPPPKTPPKTEKKAGAGIGMALLLGVGVYLLAKR